MKVLVLIFFLFLITAVADDLKSIGISNSIPTLDTNSDSKLQLPNKRGPAGDKISWTQTTNSDSQRVFHMHNHTSGSNYIVCGGWVPIALPYTNKVKNSEVVIIVEKDGRHVTAVNQDGKILWRRDPFKDAHLEFYRTSKPQIIHIDAGPGIIGITYNSSQAGYLDVATGNFTYGGQD